MRKNTLQLQYCFILSNHCCSNFNNHYLIFITTLFICCSLLTDNILLSTMCLPCRIKILHHSERYWTVSNRFAANQVCVFKGLFWWCKARLGRRILCKVSCRTVSNGKKMLYIALHIALYTLEIIPDYLLLQYMTKQLQPNRQAYSKIRENCTSPTINVSKLSFHFSLSCAYMTTNGA